MGKLLIILQKYISNFKQSISLENYADCTIHMNEHTCTDQGPFLHIYIYIYIYIYILPSSILTDCPFRFQKWLPRNQCILFGNVDFWKLSLN